MKAELILRRHFDSESKNMPFDDMYESEKNSILNAMKEYATECMENALKLASKRAKTKLDIEYEIVVDKKTIVDRENIVLI